MNLIIDQGNTFTKLAIFENGTLVKNGSFTEVSSHLILQFVQELSPQKAIVSSVGAKLQARALADELGFPVYELRADAPLPFQLKYDTPETLGLDRIALAAAAVSTYPAQNCLVIDAGTCITYDFVDRSGSFLGGAIAPGLLMRYRSLAHFTARLPLVEHALPRDLIGKSTHESIRSGVVNGMLAEVLGTIQQYEQRFPGMISVITGGDAGIFEGISKNSIFAAPNFLLHGLNYILDYYAEVL